MGTMDIMGITGIMGTVQYEHLTKCAKVNSWLVILLKVRLAVGLLKNK